MKTHEQVHAKMQQSSKVEEKKLPVESKPLVHVDQSVGSHETPVSIEKPPTFVESSKEENKVEVPPLPMWSKLWIWKSRFNPFFLQNGL